MDVKDVKKLVDAVKSAELSELIYESGEVKVTIRRGSGDPGAAAGGAVRPSVAAQPVATPAPAAAASSSDASPAVGDGSDRSDGPAEGDPKAHLVDVTAPIVGTFYAAASPDAADFVTVGDHVKAGAVLCIIEAMKLMNEIEAETSGTIAEILVRNEEPVEYGQTLFRIDPD